MWGTSSSWSWQVPIGCVQRFECICVVCGDTHSRAHHAAQVHVISVAAKRRQVDSGVAKKNTPAIHQVPGPCALIFFLLVLILFVCFLFFLFFLVFLFFLAFSFLLFLILLTSRGKQLLSYWKSKRRDAYRMGLLSGALSYQSREYACIDPLHALI